MRFLIKGFHCHEFGELIQADHFIGIAAETPEIEGQLERLFDKNGVRRRKMFGNYHFAYDVNRQLLSPHISIWKLTLFGGLVFADTSYPEYRTSGSVWAAVTEKRQDSLFTY